jgi:hypothetical protein
MFEGFVIILPIVLLLAAGAIIALRSGVHDLSTSRDYLVVAGNLSQMLLRIIGYVAVFLALQHVVGLRSSLGW